MKRHKSTKHKDSPTEAESFSVEDYSLLVNQCAHSLSEDKCYPENVRKEFRDYVFVYSPEDDDLEVIQLFEKLKIIFITLKKRRNVEKFYSSYFGLVPLKAGEYFPGISFQSSVLLATRLADRIVSFCKEKKEDGIPTAKAACTSLTTKEKSALQYLGGYVLFSLNKRLRKSKKWRTASSQQAIALVQAGKQAEDSGTAHKLVDCVNRGGLWKINIEVEQIFTIAEIHFKSVTLGDHITSINKEDIVNNLTKNHEIITFFGQWVNRAELEVHNNVSKDILYQTLLLYIKVRSFSFAKDVINRYKAKKKQLSKVKSLRKELKRKTDTPEVCE